MYNTPSLARPEWQASITDAQLKEIITNGRGRMPPTKMSDAMLSGMVRLVRMVGGLGPGPGATMPPGHPPIGGATPAPPRPSGQPPQPAVSTTPNASAVSSTPPVRPSATLVPPAPPKSSAR